MMAFSAFCAAFCAGRGSLRTTRFTAARARAGAFFAAARKAATRLLVAVFLPLATFTLTLRLVAARAGALALALAFFGTTRVVRATTRRLRVLLAFVLRCAARRAFFLAAIESVSLDFVRCCHEWHRCGDARRTIDRLTLDHTLCCVNTGKTQRGSRVDQPVPCNPCAMPFTDATSACSRWRSGSSAACPLSLGEPALRQRRRSWICSRWIGST